MNWSYLAHYSTSLQHQQPRQNFSDHFFQVPEASNIHTVECVRLKGWDGRGRFSTDGCVDSSVNQFLINNHYFYCTNMSEGRTDSCQGRGSGAMSQRMKTFTDKAMERVFMIKYYINSTEHINDPCYSVTATHKVRCWLWLSWQIRY